MPSASSVREVAALVRAAGARGETVSIDRPGGDVVLSLELLDQVLEHEAGDLTCTVEAGIRLSALQEALARQGQMLALDPPGDPTVGACIAGDLAGPRSFRYGRMRDLLLGVTAVLGDGLVASSGGKVVKNVAGYDLGKLLCGSRGGLGVIVRASLRLHPLPEAAATLVCPATSAADARARAEAVLAAGLVPTALDATDERLALLFEGSARAVTAQVGAATGLAGGSQASGDVWDEVRERPRIGPSWPVDGPLRALADRVRSELDPGGVLVAP